MDPIALLLLVVLVGAGVWFVLNRQRALPAPRSQPEPTPAGGVQLTPNLQALKPGDAVSFWDGTDATVRGSLDCREEIGGGTTPRGRGLLPPGQGVGRLPPGAEPDDP